MKLKNKNMTRQTFLCRFFWLGVLLILPACQTDYSGNAVEKARSYALENLRGITETQRDFIRYTQPQIFENTIFPRMTMSIPEQGHIKINKPEKLPQAPSKDFMHSCVVWAPPDLGALVVVSGAGERSMRGWSPNHLQVKNYPVHTLVLEAALASCAEYALNNMPSLSFSELNRIRFSNPELLLSSFPVEKKSEGDSDIQWGDDVWTAERAGKKNMKQYSLVWQGDQKDSRIVFTGYCPDNEAAPFQQWNLADAELMSVEKLKQFTEKNIRIEDLQGPSTLIFSKPEKINRNIATREQRHGLDTLLR